MDQMTQVSRRGFIVRGAIALAAIVLGPGSTRAQIRRLSRLSDIDHFVILTKENRSFDHYFGSLRGVRGFDDPAAFRSGAASVFYQADPDRAEGYLLPFRLDTVRTSAQRLPDLRHDWATQHAAWNGGAINNWISAHRAVDWPNGPLTMGFLTRQDLPFYYALADAFTICDGYHCSVFGPTHPNRFYLMSGMIDPAGLYGGPAIDNRGRGYSWETYPERLERAGISWRIYHERDDFRCNVCKYFYQYQNIPYTSPLYENAMRDRSFAELLSDLRTGNIPQVTWIVPSSTVTEHPDFLPAAGEDHTNQILQALWSNPALWATTALILNYDENDGQFDHLAPPTPKPGTPGEFVAREPIGLGFRVPCLVISPFSRGGYVCGTTFDHTSTLRLIEARFGVEIPYLSKWRRSVCGDLTAAFGFGSPSLFDIPPLPQTIYASELAEARAFRLPPPTIPNEQVLPRQEPGWRPRRG
jgi:phospholipase C